MPIKIRRNKCNDEAALQKAIIRWANYQPIVKDYLHANANGGSRHPFEAKSLKEQGVRAGVSDLFLPLARGGYHGLYIECKTPKGTGRLSPAQKEWLDLVAVEGYLGVVVNDFTTATTLINNYSQGLIERAQ